MKVCLELILQDVCLPERDIERESIRENVKAGVPLPVFGAKWALYFLRGRS